MSTHTPTALTNAYIARGRLLQARAVRAAFAALFRWRVRRPLRPVVRPTPNAC